MTCDDVLSKLAGFDGRPGAVSKYLKVTIQYVLRRRTKALSFLYSIGVSNMFLPMCISR